MHFERCLQHRTIIAHNAKPEVDDAGGIAPLPLPDDVPAALWYSPFDCVQYPPHRLSSGVGLQYTFEALSISPVFRERMNRRRTHQSDSIRQISR